jgi:hypothetical protein
MEKLPGANLERVKMLLRNQLTFLFDVDEEVEQTSYPGTIPQALMLINGSLVNLGVTAVPGTALADLLAMPLSDGEKIEALFLRTVSRRPTADELKRLVEYLAAKREVVLSPAGGGVARLPPLRGKGAGVPDPLERLNVRYAKSYQPTPKDQAFEDLFWALLNSSEFFFQH